MRKIELDMKSSMQSKSRVSPPPPPPLPPLPQPRPSHTRPAKASWSVTREEIARFWRQKKMVEEDHLLSAIKAAARIRARNLKEEDYRQFEESLKESDDNSKDENNDNDKDNKEIRVGIKDWWTKSNYAYLNQPAIQNMDPPKRDKSTYIPNLCFYKAPPPQPFSLGVF